MRTAPGKEIGYIICPILIPPNADPERWLSTSNKEEGWQELGQILNALRSHDQRIEDNLADLLHLYIPEPPEVEVTIVAVAGGDEKRINYREHEGAARRGPRGRGAGAGREEYPCQGIPSHFGDIFRVHNQTGRSERPRQALNSRR